MIPLTESVVPETTTKLRGGSRGKRMDKESLNLLIMIETRPDITLGVMQNFVEIGSGISEEM